MRITLERSRSIFGNPPKPNRVTEKQFDGFDHELKRIGTLDWSEIEDGDLWYYIHDLSYMELQKDLFNYLFPVCLNYWYQSLLRSESAECGDAELHYAIHHGNILKKMTTKSQTEEIYNFFHDGFIDRVELERGFKYSGTKTPAYGILYRFNSIGYIAPIIGAIWTTWWNMDHPGKAVAAIKYASGLIYMKGGNPIFGEWTCNEGGGGPYLTESDACIYDASWLHENIDFMRKTISVEYIQDKMHHASKVLTNEPESEIAELVAKDSLANIDILALKIDDLIEGLSKPEGAVDWE